MQTSESMLLTNGYASSKKEDTNMQGIIGKKHRLRIKPATSTRSCNGCFFDIMHDDTCPRDKEGMHLCTINKSDNIFRLKEVTC